MATHDAPQIVSARQPNVTMEWWIPLTAALIGGAIGAATTALRPKRGMKIYTDEINWKGIGDYLSAAKTLAKDGSTNTSGPRIHCQGLALELALKFYLRDKTGRYLGTHDLKVLAKKCHDLHFSGTEVKSIQQLNRQYLKDGRYPYPARYRPSATRIVCLIDESTLEDLIAKIIRSTSRADLVEAILSR